MPTPAADEAKAVRAAALIVLLAFFAFYKWSFNHCSPSTGVDGGYYTNIAENVRDGNGLVTNISLYHHGYPSLPYPSSVYPMWPLLYGLSARATGLPLDLVGCWLPTALFFASLLCGYRWAARLFPGRFLNGGHLFVLMLGTHTPFFEATSRPYTEGLAMALLTGALLRFHSLLRTPGFRSGIELGLWSAAIVLTRSQYVTFAVSGMLALGCAAFISDSRKAYATMLSSMTAVFGAVFAVRLYSLKDLVENASLATLFRFDLNQATSLLRPITVLAKDPEYLSAVLNSFRWAAPHSYTSAFHLFPFALFLVLPVVLSRSCFHSLSAASRNRKLEILFLATFALGSFLALYGIQKRFGSPWLFPTRQAVTSVFIFFFACMLLVRSRWQITRVGALLIILGSCYVGWQNLNRIVVSECANRASPAVSPLVQWLNQEKNRRGALTVAMDNHRPQVFSPFTRGVNYHWIYSLTSDSEIDVLIRTLRVDLFILDSRFQTKISSLVAKRLRHIETVDGYQIYDAVAQ